MIHDAGQLDDIVQMVGMVMEMSDLMEIAAFLLWWLCIIPYHAERFGTVCIHGFVMWHAISCEPWGSHSYIWHCHVICHIMLGMVWHHVQTWFCDMACLATAAFIWMKWYLHVWHCIVAFHVHHLDDMPRYLGLPCGMSCMPFEQYRMYANVTL